MPRAMHTLPPPTNEFPVAFPTFVQRLYGTPDEVWIVLMKNSLGHRKFTEVEWIKQLERLKTGR